MTPPRPNPLPALQEVLAASARVAMLTGPAACGKTETALAFYEHFAGEDGPRCLLLAPNAPAVAALRRKLLERSPRGAMVSPQVTTFAALATRVLAARQPVRILPAFQRHLLLRRIVSELSAAGQLEALAPIADTGGLIDSLDRSIAELKRAAVDPEALAAAVGRQHGKNADLLRVYRRYQQCLHEMPAYDLEGQMWLLRDRLGELPANAPLPAIEGIRAVAADGFTDFTPTQLRVLALLAERMECTLVTLVLGDDARQRMWHWTRRTRDNLRRAFGDGLREIALPPAGPPPLQPAWEKVFDIDASPTPPPQGLEVVAAAGADAEIATVAARVKRLLADGAPAGSIAVVARSLEGRRETIERIFAECDIPIAPSPVALPDVPIVRFVLDAASLAPQFAFRDVLRVLQSSYFRPETLGPFDRATVAAAQAAIRQGNVLEGRDAYARACDRLARRAESIRAEEQVEDDEAPASPAESPARFAAAGQMLEALFDLSARCGKSRDLRPLLAALDLPTAAQGSDEPAIVARDLRALAALDDALSQIPPGEAPTDWDALRRALEAVRCLPERRESLVDVLDVLDARSLRYDHLLLVGAGEGELPRKFDDVSLMGETDRAAWARRGVRLDSRSDLAAREMLLFYLAVSRADRSLTLSYLESDSSGRPGAPGSFLLSLLQPFGGIEALAGAGRVETVPPGQFVPPQARLASRRDAFNGAVAGWFRDEPADAGLLPWAARAQPEKIARCAAGLFARHRRWTAGACDRFDGRIASEDLRDELAARFGARHVFSASQLSAYGQCPWQFFAAYVLDLRPLEAPARRMEAVALGVFCHNVLFRVYSALRDQTGGPVRLAELETSRIDAALDAAVAAEAAEVETRPLPYPALWAIQRDQMRRQLRAYLHDQRKDASSEAAHFELGFATERFDPSHQDPASTPDAVPVDLPSGPILLRGKIDRVDRLSDGGMLVVDYKTGRLPGKADLDAGRNLQMPLYATAAEKLLGVPCAGGAFHSVPDLKQVHFSRLTKPPRETRDFDERLADALATADGFVRGIREGRFDALPSHKCPRFCPYRRICQYAEPRARLKTSRSVEGQP